MSTGPRNELEALDAEVRVLEASRREDLQTIAALRHQLAELRRGGGGRGRAVASLVLARAVGRYLCEARSACLMNGNVA